MQQQTHQEDTPAFWDTYTEHKGATAFPMNEVSEFLSGRILDLGCGDGTHVRQALAYGTELYGIDYSPDVVERAKQLVPEASFQPASAYALPYGDDFFDAVYSVDVIEHLEDPERMLKEAQRVLKPGGWIVIQTPNYPIKRVYDAYHTFAKNAWRTSFADDPTHVYKFPATALRRMMAKYFRIEKAFPRNVQFEGRFPRLRAWRKKGSLLALLLGQKTIVVGQKEKTE